MIKQIKKGPESILEDASEPIVPTTTDEKNEKEKTTSK